MSDRRSCVIIARTCSRDVPPDANYAPPYYLVDSHVSSTRKWCPASRSIDIRAIRRSFVSWPAFSAVTNTGLTENVLSSRFNASADWSTIIIWYIQISFSRKLSPEIVVCLCFSNFDDGGCVCQSFEKQLTVFIKFRLCRYFRRGRCDCEWIRWTIIGGYFR